MSNEFPPKWYKLWLRLIGNANGHPAMYDYIDDGYEIITL